jgi:hypothetical protein
MSTFDLVPPHHTVHFDPGVQIPPSGPGVAKKPLPYDTEGNFSHFRPFSIVGRKMVLSKRKHGDEENIRVKTTTVGGLKRSPAVDDRSA